jgi:uncharacterized protein
MENNSVPLTTNRKQSNKRNFIWRKRTAAFSRWLHLYLSMLCFLIVLFFSATGITLNHVDWFNGTQSEKKLEGKMPVEWLNSADTSKIKKMEIVELFRNKYGVKGYVSDFLIDDEQCSVSFKGPGYSADAFISRKDGAMQLTELRLGLIAVLNDLHKGRDSGKSWSWLIDISAIFLTLVSLSGLLLLLFLKKRRLNGLIIAIVGGGICYLVYLLWVP